MAVGVFPFEGKEEVLRQMLALGVQANWALGLFVNVGFTPDLNTVLTDIVEAGFSGYTGSITLSSYSAIYTYAARDKATDAVAVIFSHDGGGIANTVTGWFVWDNVENKLIWVELFDVPKVMAIVGNIISLLPTEVLGKLLP